MRMHKKDFVSFVNSKRMLIYCFAVAFGVLLICTKSSFLYPFNDWVDAQCFFTVGKGMMRGMVVYRDLFEQKGILLYFLHGLAYLVSNTGFEGVFALEVVAGTAFLYYSARISGLFISERSVYILIPLFAAAIYSSKWFAHGDSAEEFCLPMLMACLYYLFRRIRCGDELSNTILTVCGVLAGCVLWIKYNMLGFWLAWLPLVCLGFAAEKRCRKAIKYCLCFIAGLVLSTVPWFIYFALSGALGDWINAYFVMNISNYARLSSFTGMLGTVISNVWKNIVQSPPLLAFSALTVTGLMFTNTFARGLAAKILLFVLPAALAFGIYCGGRDYVYYFLPLLCFILPGFITLFRFAGLLSDKLALRLRKKVSANASAALFTLAVAVTLALSLAGAYLGYQYRDFMSQKKDELAQFRFAKIMNAEPVPTMLNYGFLDGGFYTAADILPSTKYFCTLNMELREMTDAQNEMIKNKKVRFVILRYGGVVRDYGFDVPYLKKNYECVDIVKQDFENWEATYCLFRIKNAG